MVPNASSPIATPRTNWRLLTVLGAALAVVGTAVATSSAATEPPAPTQAAAPALGDPITGLRGTRYCELILLKPRGLSLTASVWGTFGVSDCPQAQWRALNIALLSWQNRALVMRNGPRYWMIDKVQGAAEVARPTKAFGGMTLRFGATISGLNPFAIRPLQVQRVARSAVMTFESGRTVYELTSPDGRTFVMQSYSQQVDSTLTAADLPTLAGRLQLPAGWRYSERTLSAPLVIDTTTTRASVIQDRFHNTYSLEASN